MRYKNIRFPTDALAIVCLAVLSWLYLYHLTSSGKWYWSHENAHYPYILEHFRDAILHGIWYPRWLPKVAFGYGYPTFIIYQPGFFFLGLPFAMVFDDIILAMYFFLSSMVFLGGLGAYRLANLYCSKPASFACAIIFLTLPYATANIIVRGDLSESLGMFLCPYAIYYLIRLCDSVRQGAPSWHLIVTNVFVMMLVIVSHPFVSLFAIPVLGLLTLGKWVEAKYRLDMLFVVGLCFALAITLTSPYWLTGLLMQKDVNAHVIPRPIGTVKTIGQLFRPGFYCIGTWQPFLALAGYILAIRLVFARYALATFLLLTLFETKYGN
ncbi:MAG: hypothetical protein K2Q01_03120, partial [Rickettsiales bacterium]|nr:hypothetical protein [Rickettsiales bacterium]